MNGENSQKHPIEQVRRSGDVLGAHFRLYDSIGKQAMIYTCLAGGLAQGLTGNRLTENPSALLASPFYLGLGAIFGGYIYQSLRRTEKRDIETAAHVQDAIRELFDDEPIDVIRTRADTSAAYQLLLRWYGSETREEVSPEILASRFGAIMEHEPPVDKVIVGTGWLEELGYQPEQLQELGKVQDGRGFFHQLKHKVVDAYSDSQVLVMSSAAAQALASELLKRFDVVTTSGLVAQLATARHSSRVPMLYGEYERVKTTESGIACLWCYDKR